MEKFSYGGDTTILAHCITRSGYIVALHFTELWVVDRCLIDAIQQIYHLCGICSFSYVY
jgi:hypothetical protein